MIHAVNVLMSVDFDELQRDMDFLGAKACECKDPEEADKYMRIRSMLLDVYSFTAPFHEEFKKRSLSSESPAAGILWTTNKYIG